jgi:hypothetical protein
MSVKVRTKGAEKAGWQRSLASRTPKSIILGAVAWLNFSDATAPFSGIYSFFKVHQRLTHHNMPVRYLSAIMHSSGCGREKAALMTIL